MRENSVLYNVVGVLCGAAVCAWHFCFLVLACGFMGAAVFISLLGTGLLFVADGLGETAENLMETTGIFNDDVF